MSYKVFTQDSDFEEPSGESVHTQRVESLQLDLISCFRAVRSYTSLCTEDYVALHGDGRL